MRKILETNLGRKVLRDQPPNAESRCETYLPRGSVATGTLTFGGSVRLEGRVEGEIAAENTVVIAEHAMVNGPVTADVVIISGRVIGDVTGRRRVEIKPPGELHGNITTSRFVAHDRVVFEGRCSMGTPEANVRLLVSRGARRRAANGSATSSKGSS